MKNRKAFTFVEFLIVITVIFILSFLITGIIKNDKKQRALAMQTSETKQIVVESKDGKTTESVDVYLPVKIGANLYFLNATRTTETNLSLMEFLKINDFKIKQIIYASDMFSSISGIYIIVE